jgi:hypothetical protein
MLVEPREIAGAEGDFFGFETLTFAPIDRTLVDPGAADPGRGELVERLSRLRQRNRSTAIPPQSATA